MSRVVIKCDKCGCVFDELSAIYFVGQLAVCSLCNAKTAGTAPGVKHDTGKTRPSLVIGGFAAALEEVAKVGTFGAAKYTDDGWATVPNGVKRYTDAMLRHQLTEFRGEKHDPESGLHHAAHAAWNALARLELLLREKP